MAEERLSPEAMQKLAIDIANDVARRISATLGQMSKTPMGCNPGPFDCPREFLCSSFAAIVPASEASEPAKVTRRR